eukprot:gene27340-33025_t
MFKAIKGNVQLVQLDTIVTNTVKDFDKKISKQTFETGMSKEDVSALEATMIENAFESYDRRAAREVGGKVPADWSGDNKDPMAVRKRMLRRELEKRKGILLQLFEGTNSGKLAEIEAFLRGLEEINGNFYRSLEFPMPQSALKTAIVDHEIALLGQINERFLGGLDALDSQSIPLKGEAAGSIFMQRVRTMAAEALNENQNTTTQARNAYAKRTLARVQDHLQKQLKEISITVAAETDAALSFCDTDERQQTREVLQEAFKQYLKLDSSVEELALASLTISHNHTDTELPETTEVM